MTPRERVWAALRGEPVDRPPISFWGHFYHRESSAEELVDATLEFHERYRWDWVKLNPRKHYHVEPWGVRYRYPGVPNQKPTLSDWPIRSGDDWAKIGERPHDAGALGEQLEAVRMLRRRLDPDVPMIQTVFTPLAILGEMTQTPGELRGHLSTHPALVRAALEAVTATFERYVRAVLDAGADGIYFATVDWAERSLMSAEDYRTWARAWDERILAVATGAPFNVLHVCRDDTLVRELADEPVAAISWAAGTHGNPGLGELKAVTRAAVMGGIAHEGALQSSDAAALMRELDQGYQATGGTRWLVAPSCSIPPTTPAAQLERLRAAVDARPSMSTPA